MNALELNRIHPNWCLFPCAADKSPLVVGGFHSSSNDPAIISRWGKTAPLIGVACTRSGVFAVDIDDPVSWKYLVSKFGEGTPTLTQTTPRGGFHLIYKQPADIDIPNNAGKLWPGVDLRSNGYICTGAGYQWVGERGIYTLIAEAPEWLLDMIRPKEQTPAQRESHTFHLPDDGLPGYFLDKYGREARPGVRNQIGFALALQLRDCGLSYSDAETYMLEYARRVPTGMHPYSEAEAVQTLKSAYSRRRRNTVIPGYRCGL